MSSRDSSERLLDYENRYYEELREGSVRVRVSDSLLRCPYCDQDNRRDYTVGELLDHVSNMSSSSSMKEKAKHLALERFVKKRYGSRNPAKGSPFIAKGSPVEKRAGARERSTANREESSSHGTGNQNVDNRRFVWPPMAVLANIKTNLKEERIVGESGSKLRDEFRAKGLGVEKVVPLWSSQGHSGFAVVHFEQNWNGFHDAVVFEKSFESQNGGKKDFYGSRDRGDRLYGWIAMDDDYYSRTLFGKHLQKKGDLKSVTEKQEEDLRNQLTLQSSLVSTIEKKSAHIQKMETEYERTKRDLKNVMAQKEDMLKAYNEKTTNLQMKARDHFEKLFLEHEKARRELQAQQKELEEQETALERREYLNESNRRKLKRETIERAVQEQKKADANMLRLAEAQQREKEELHRKIIDLQKELDDKQALELEIQRLRGAQEVMEHMKDDPEAPEKMNEIKQQLKEKEEELEMMDEMTQALIVKDRKNTDELTGARKELIAALTGPQLGRATVGVKRMGELDIKPFIAATEKKYGKGGDAKLQAVKLCSLWEDLLRDPNWHPFKIITHEGKTTEIIDEDDEKLKPLRQEFGDEVYVAVITALREMNEYNPSGRYSVPELWNFKQNKRASLKEGVERVLNQWKTIRKRRM